MDTIRPGVLQSGAGIVRFFPAVQELAATQYHYGLGAGCGSGSTPRCSTKSLRNPKPHKVRYQDVLEMLVKFSKSLAEAEAMLAKVDAAKGVKLELLGSAWLLDINGDGMASEEECFWKIFAAANPAVNTQKAESFVIQADGGMSCGFGVTATSDDLRGLPSAL